MKAFKPLPSNHQWSKKKFSLLFKFLKLTEKKYLYVQYYGQHYFITY